MRLHYDHPVDQGGAKRLRGKRALKETHRPYCEEGLV